MDKPIFGIIKDDKDSNSVVVQVDRVAFDEYIARVVTQAASTVANYLVKVGRFSDKTRHKESYALVLHLLTGALARVLAYGMSVLKANRQHVIDTLDGFLKEYEDAEKATKN